MADINVERKRKGGPLLWLLPLLVLAALLLLLLRGCDDDEPDTAPASPDTVGADTSNAMPPVAAPQQPATGPGAAGAAAGALAIGDILGDPARFGGQTVGGTATVPETPSDRGFWVEANGQRIFAILAEPSEQVKDIDPGQTVRLSNARVLRGADAAQIPQDVDAEARSTAQGQPAFLLVPANGVEIVAGGNTVPG